MNKCMIYGLVGFLSAILLLGTGIVIGVAVKPDHKSQQQSTKPAVVTQPPQNNQPPVVYVRQEPTNKITYRSRNWVFTQDP